MSAGPWELFQSPDQSQAVSVPAPTPPDQSATATPTPSPAPAQPDQGAVPDGPWKMFAPSGASTPASADAAPAEVPDDHEITVHASRKQPPAPTPAPSDNANGSSPGILDQIDAGVRAAANGITLGYADRLAAGVGALTGIGGAKGDYAGNLAGQQALTKIDDAKYPVTTTASGIGGAVAGALALPVAETVAAAPTLLGKIGASTALGAGAGALGGASASPDLTNLSDTAQRAGTGAVLGGGVGMLLPGVTSGFGTAYRSLAGGTGLPAGVNRAAASKVAEAINADREGVAQLADLGPEALLPDAGPSLLGLAQGVATKPGEGRTALVDALANRNAGTNARIQSDINDALGPASSPMAIANNLKAVRAGIHNELPDIFQNAPPVDVSPVLSFIGDKLNTAVGGEKAALTKARDYLMEESPSGFPMPVSNAEKVANAKAELQSLIDFGDPTIGVQPGALARADGVTRRIVGSLNERLRRQVPGYASVMDRSSALAKTIDSIEEGQGVLSSGPGAIRPDDFARRLDTATEAERRGMQVGTRSAIDRSVGTKLNDLQALKADLQGEGGWNEQKIAALFGQKAAQDLSASVDRNQRFRTTFGKVVENSQTAQRMAASQELDRAAQTAPIIPKNATIGGLVANAGESALRMIAEGKADFEGKKTRAAIGRILATPASQAREQQLMKILDRTYIVDQQGKRLGNAAALLTSAVGREATQRLSMERRR